MGYDLLPEDQVYVNYPMGPDIKPQRGTDTTGQPTVLGAAFRRGNWIGNAIDALHQPYKPTPGYDVVNEIKDDPQYWPHRDAFFGSQSPDETQFIKARIDRQLVDEKTISDAGWGGTVSGIAAGLLDPFNLVAGGEIYRGGRLVADAGKSLLHGAGAGALAAAASTVMMNQSKPEGVPLGDAIFNISSSAILGGILGAGASRFMNAKQIAASTKAFDDLKARMKSGETPPTDTGASLSAAEADTRQLEPVGMGKVGELYSAGLEKLKAVPYVGKPVAAVVDAVPGLVRNIGPTNRVAYGRFVEAKRAMFDMADTPIVFNENLEGRPTVQGGGPSIETRARMEVEGGRYRMKEALDGLYSDYRYGSQQGVLGQLRGTIQDAMGNAPDGILSFEDFKTEIAKAMRRGDIPAVPQIQQAVQYLRKDIFEPWKQAAIDAKLLPEDVGVETADSYLNRLYDREKIISERPQFEGKITDWLTDTQNHNAGIQRQLQDNFSRRGDLQKQLGKLEGRQATALNRYQTSEQRLSERQMEATATEKRFDTVDQRAQDATAAVADMKQFANDLKASGNSAEIRQQIAALEKEAKGLEGGLKPVSQTDLDAADKSVRGVLTGPMRRVAKILMGDAKLPKGVEPFWKYVARLGGVKDDGGDLLSRLGARPIAKGGKSGAKGLFNKGGIQWDDLQQKLADAFPELKARGYGATDKLAEDFSDDIRQAIVDSVGGKEPSWYTESVQPDDHAFVTETVNQIDRMQQEGLIPEFHSMQDAAEFFSGRSADLTAADYDKMIADLENSSGSMDHRIAATDLHNAADVRRESIDLLKSTLVKAKANIGKAKVADKVAGAVADEAGIAANRNMSRADILDLRSQHAATQHELLGKARITTEQEIERLRAEAEQHVTDWKGKSSTEALSALKSRAESEQVRRLKQQADIQDASGVDPLKTAGGDWRDATVNVTADGKPATVNAGKAVDSLMTRMKALSQLLDCLNAG